MKYLKRFSQRRLMLKTELQARWLGIRYYRQDVTTALPPSVSVKLNLLYCLFYSTYTVDTEFVHKKNIWRKISMNYKCNENSLGGCGKTKEIILVSLNSKKAINISWFSYGIYLKRSANYQQRLFGSFKKMRNANHMVSLKFCVVLMARKRPTE